MPNQRLDVAELDVIGRIKWRKVSMGAMVHVLHAINGIWLKSRNSNGPGGDVLFDNDNSRCLTDTLCIEAIDNRTICARGDHAMMSPSNCLFLKGKLSNAPSLRFLSNLLDEKE